MRTKIPQITDERIEFINRLHDMHVDSDFSPDNHNAISRASIHKIRESFPLCMQSCFEALHTKHYFRYFYNEFTKILTAELLLCKSVVK